MSAHALPANGKSIASEADVLDVIGALYGTETDTVIVPVARLSPEFFRLSNGLAGAILQKFTNYHLKVAIVGDISAYTDRSGPLRDFVRESNRRGEIRFLATAAEL